MYTPDKWVIVRITSKEHPQIDKILGSWYGGYAGSDEWRFSSGITKIEDTEHFYIIHNHSGSQYFCRKGCEGMSAYTEIVANNLATQLEEGGLGMMRVISIQEAQEK
jgi:hypothetical protein